MRSATSESQSPKAGVRSGDIDGGRGALLTLAGLAAALRVSVRTVDRMVANGDIPCIRVRGRVRFCLADVVECLRSGDGKWGRKAAQPVEVGNPNPETRYPRRAE